MLVSCDQWPMRMAAFSPVVPVIVTVPPVWSMVAVMPGILGVQFSPM